jgi:eukaryotic-like serine/threonine-protein kinase
VPVHAAEGAASEPLTEAFKAQVLTIVTRKMGPIARVMVKRAADAGAGSRAHFVQVLLDALPEADRWTVQGEINKLG